MTSSQRCVTTSSSTTAAWARRSSNSTSRWNATTSLPGAPRSAGHQPPRRHRGRPRLDARGRRRGPDDRHASRRAGIKLDEWGLGEHTLEINRKAAEIARKAAGEQPLRGRLDRPDRPPARLRRSDARADQLPRARRRFTEQSRGLLEGGVDLLIIETAQDILEVKAAVFGAREAFKAAGRRVPIQVSVSLLPNGGKMLLGTDIDAR